MSQDSQEGHRARTRRRIIRPVMASPRTSRITHRALRGSSVGPAAGSSRRRPFRVAEPILGVAFFLALWAFVSWRINNANLLPSPAAVARAFRGMLDDELPHDIGASLVH